MNIHIGSNSGLHSITTRNVNIGSNCGMYNVCGQDCVHIGTNAAERAKNTKDNVCIGADAGRYLEKGENNVFIGKDVGTNIVRGSNNVWIGSNSTRHDHSLALSDFIHGDDERLTLNRDTHVKGDLECRRIVASHIKAESYQGNVESVHVSSVTGDVRDLSCDTVHCQGSIVTSNIQSDNLSFENATGSHGNIVRMTTQRINTDTLSTNMLRFDLDLSLSWFLANVNPNENGQTITLFDNGSFRWYTHYNTRILNTLTSAFVTQLKRSTYILVNKRTVYCERYFPMKDVISNDFDSNDYTLKLTVNGVHMIGYYDYTSQPYFDISSIPRGNYDFQLQAYEHSGTKPLAYVSGGRNNFVDILTDKVVLR